MEALTRQTLFTRDDTFLGICQGLGEDLGVSPDLFRVAMIPALFFFPVQALAAYFGAGAVVLFSRLVFPAVPRVRNAQDQHVEVPPTERQDGIDHGLQMAA